MRQKVKTLRKIRIAVEQGSGLWKACRAMNMSPTTLWRWRKKDRRIDNYIEAAVSGQIQAVEDALFKTALEGNTTAQIFYLTNRAGDKWKDRRASVNNKIINSNTVKGSDDTSSFDRREKEARAELRKLLGNRE